MKSNLQNDEDEPYIINYQIKIDDDDAATGIHIEKEKFRFSISTKRLLRIASRFARLIQADSTYKLIWNGNPVLIIGFSDSNNAFHPICLAVTSDETHFDYQFLFESLQKGIAAIGFYFTHMC